MILLVFDPGETTGFAVMNPEGWPEKFPEILERGVISKWRGARRLVKEYKPDVIIAEQFYLYAHKAKAQVGGELVAVRVLGALELIAEESEIPFIVQSAAVGKSVRLPDEVFDQLRGNIHQKDAVCHGIAWLRSKSA